MPMEYDDNDFEDQNHHLTGEGNSKFSPVLRPYALPKFDFGDSLHGPLRFDNLVENEVFLGIPSQEESNWIENFSRGSGAIEFGSTGPESCSIARHNNAWSEAASSESVEMLLKSVGQDEMIPGETIIEESEPCDVLDSLHDQMVGCYPSQLGGDITVVEKYVADEPKCDPPNTTELQTSGKHLLCSDLGKHPSAGIEIDGSPINNTSSSQNAEASEVVLSHRESHDLKSANCPSNDIGDAVNQVLSSHKEGNRDETIRESSFASANCALDNLPHPLSKADSEEVHRIKSVSDEPSYMPLDVNHELQAITDFGKSACSKDYNQSCDKRLAEISESAGNEVLLKVSMDSDLIPCTDKQDLYNCGDVSNSIVGSCYNSEMMMDQTNCCLDYAAEEKQNLQGNDDQLDSKPPKSIVENSIAIGNSMELTDEKQVHESVEGVINVCGIHKEYLNANESVSSSSTLAETLQLTKGSIVSGKDNDDTCPNLKENARFPSESIDVEAEQIGSYVGEDRVVSAPDEKTMELGNDTVTESEDETIAMKHKAVSDIEVSNLVHVDLKEEASLLHVESKSIGEMENIDAETLKEPNGSPKESPEVVGNLYPVPELEKTASYGSSGELKQGIMVQHLSMEKACSSVVDSIQLKEQDMVDQSLPVAYTSDAANVNEQLKKAKEGSQNSSEKIEVNIISCDPEVKKGTGAVVPVFPGDQVVSAVCAGGDNSCELDSEMLSVTSNPDLYQNDQGKEGEVLESSINIPLLPEVVKVASVFHKPSGNGAPKVDPSIGMTSSSECFLKEKSTKGTPSSTVRRTSKKSTGSVSSPSTPAVNQTNSKLAADVLRDTSKGHAEPLCERKQTTESKTKRGSGKAKIKDGAKKGSFENEIPSAKQSENGNKTLTSPLIISGSPPVQFEGLKSYGKVEHGSASCLTPVSSSKLPDWNTSIPPLFKKPFTNLQQVQLRAQIFAFGYLRQGTVPDEACMASAFGVPDGGMALDPVWRASLERFQGARCLEQQIKQSVPQIVLSSTVGRQSSMETPPVGNSILPFSSSLWNVSTPTFESLHSSGLTQSVYPDCHQASLPLNPYQTPPSRGFRPSPSWLSQGPFPVPWVATLPSSAPDGNTRLSGRSMTETVKLTPSKESSAPVISGLKQGSLASIQLGSSSISANISVPELKKDIVASKQMTGEVKSRKRKKVPDCEFVGQTSLVTQAHKGIVSAFVSPTHLSTSLAISTPNIVSKGNVGNTMASLLPPPSTDHESVGKRQQQPVLISEDSSAKVEDSRLQAKNAAVLAAAAVNQRQSVWNQMAKQKNSNIGSEVEIKLVSAAVAIDAAASVARAAAAAAQVASNAALQAKLLADEALSTIGTYNSVQMTTASLSDAVNNLVKLDAASILKGGNGGNPSSLSITVAAKEAAQRRIESTSSASRHAEKLDAILKAAELAADAVAQAGKIIVMNDPLPLSQLLEAGPGGHWRVTQLPPQQVSLLSNLYREPSGEIPPNDYPGTSGTQYVNRHSFKEKNSNHGEFPLTSGVVPLKSTENNMVTAYGNLEINISVQKEATSNKPLRASNVTKAILPESGTGPILTSFSSEELVGEEAASQVENKIKEGCLVEVCKEGVSGQVAWFPATVLNVKDGKAFVHLMELKSNDGPLKEWITIEVEGCLTPKIRTPHPKTVTQLEGTKKRCRAAMGDFTFSSGDRVDVWVQYCWQEGIVIEKNKKDETTFTVGFPGVVETMVVSSWNIRPTLVWCDGKWIDWSSTRGRSRLSQGDTPLEKRLKRGDSVHETHKEDKRSNHIDFAETQFLPLSSREQVFNVGKKTEEENKINTLRTARTGLQTEGSRVIFGVPKPGKKKKFMEVSKHYVAEREPRIINEASDSVKYAKYTIPQGIGTREWKSNIKVDRKENQGAESKVKGSRLGKPPNMPTRPLPKKDKVLASAVLARQEDNIDRTVLGDENGPGHKNQMEIGSSNTDGEEQGNVPFSSSVELPKNVHQQRSSARSENKGKAAPHEGRMDRLVEVNEKNENVEYGKSDLEVSEPRRSSRKIQPTSRLLEGLQSSLVITKFASASHDKSHKSHTSKGNGHG